MSEKLSTDMKSPPLSREALAEMEAANQRARVEAAIETCRREGVVPLSIVGRASNGDPVFAPSMDFFPEETVSPTFRWGPRAPEIPKLKPEGSENESDHE